MLVPRYRFRRIWEIPPEWLKLRGVSVILADVDNTLTTHNSQHVPPEVTAWLQKVDEQGLKVLILSNNSRERVEPFAQKLGLGCIARAKKPLGGGVRRASQRLGVSPRRIAVIGDQLFTDILCANWVGALSILVDPMESEDFLFFRIKRRLERYLLKHAPGYEGEE